MTYFNPPFSKHVRTNVGGKFLKLIDKCFPKQHELRKIVNRNTIKVSYRCMPSFKAAITRHNSNLMKSEQVPAAPPGCNCRDHPCPLTTNDCQTDHVIYRATVTDQNQNINTYTGLTGYTFKKRYDGHTYSFRHRGEKSTTLSSHLWDLSDKNIQYDLKWELVDRPQEFNPSTRKCRLCNKEKYYIIFQPEGATLNLRSELFSSCRHRMRLLLSRIKT